MNGLMSDLMVIQAAQKIEAGGHRLFLYEQHMNGRLGDGEQLHKAISYLTGGHAPELSAQQWDAVYKMIADAMFSPMTGSSVRIRYESTIISEAGESLGVMPSCTAFQLREYCGWMGERLLQQAAVGSLISVSATFQTENGQATWTVSKL